MKRREEELLLLPGANERWENFMQYTQSRMVPRFTEKGFEVIKIPPAVFAKLKALLEKGLENWDAIPTEPQIDAVYTPKPSKFISLGPLAQEIGRDLKPLHEAWSGMEMRHTSAYGIRLYQEGASLVMHYDKIHTHVISSIVHIGHEYFDDNEPWPIEIEDHDGVRHAVNLEPGEMLFYESASCLHGRRQVLKGKYYASIFVHFQPVDINYWNFHIDDVINNVPPFWREGVVEEEGNRWAGQGLTIDSQVTDGAPPRTIHGQPVPDLKEWHKKNNPKHYRFLQEHLRSHDAYIAEAVLNDVPHVPSSGQTRQEL
eukprot:CAMPEP_0202963618 /NCGR_PEP_ID=MMETSP1396-20130829/7635_1 /ASSEMBLY_ACC=CAM_ASM_000872 /TAXON_ID= /ORGANISM="Pseudokeronopsis sp., Strain Brazil" /LENGTH=313 /DNA_ID=CAMNT_0049684997 /DNA_START=230 /DNA_END=1171 /DNA_ORIENTATION=+